MPLAPSELRGLVEGYLDDLALTPELGSLAGPMRHALGDGLGDTARPSVDLLGVLRADLLPGQVPLVEQKQRLSPRLSSRDAHAATDRNASSVDVE